eukprot:6210630-Pleurochrysis_carterae.AAC.3
MGGGTRCWRHWALAARECAKSDSPPRPYHTANCRQILKAQLSRPANESAPQAVTVAKGSGETFAAMCERGREGSAEAAATTPRLTK